MIYGTAWKEERTEALVQSALSSGFKAIDTANQRKHYHEAGVGAALKHAFDQGLDRDDLFIQTKFTSINGQDHRLPYEADAKPASQVQQSFERSLTHLGLSFIDAYVLHGPCTGQGLIDTDWEIWQAMEALLDAGHIGAIGISNVNIEQLKALYDGARIKPQYVQNRCYAQLGWDYSVLSFCLKNNIHYQGFSLLTANPMVLAQLGPLSQKHQKTPEQVIFRFSQQVGMIPLTGTSSLAHMALDLDLDFSLSDDEIQQIAQMGLGH